MGVLAVDVRKPKEWNSGQYLAAQPDHPANLCTILNEGDDTNRDDCQPLCKQVDMKSSELWKQVKRSGVLGDSAYDQTADWARRGTAAYIKRTNGERLRDPPEGVDHAPMWKKRGLLDGNDADECHDLEERVGHPFVTKVRRVMAGVDQLIAACHL